MLVKTAAGLGDREETVGPELVLWSRRQRLMLGLRVGGRGFPRQVTGTFGQPVRKITFQIPQQKTRVCDETVGYGASQTHFTEHAQNWFRCFLLPTVQRTH